MLLLAIAVLADVEPEWPRESIAPPHNESRADRIELPREVNDIHKKRDRIHEWPLGVQPAGCHARHHRRWSDAPLVTDAAHVASMCSPTRRAADDDTQDRELEWIRDG